MNELMDVNECEWPRKIGLLMQCVEFCKNKLLKLSNLNHLSKANSLDHRLGCLLL